MKVSAVKHPSGMPVHTHAASEVAAAGSDTQVQFNDGGVMAGDAGLTYNKTTDVLSVNGGVNVPAETYGAGWSGDGGAPTKDDLYTKIEQIGYWHAHQVQFDNAGLAVASTTGSVELFTTGDRELIEVKVWVETDFVLGKGGVSSATVGVSGDEDLLMGSSDLAVTGSGSAHIAGGLVNGFTAVSIYVTGDTDLNNFSQGTITVYARRSIAPTP